MENLQLRIAVQRGQVSAKLIDALQNGKQTLVDRRNWLEGNIAGRQLAISSVDERRELFAEGVLGFGNIGDSTLDCSQVVGCRFRRIRHAAQIDHHDLQWRRRLRIFAGILGFGVRRCGGRFLGGIFRIGGHECHPLFDGFVGCS